MVGQTNQPGLTGSIDSRTRFVGTIAILLIILIGHFYIIQGMTSVVLGMPTWVWLQVGTLVVLSIIAYIATEEVMPGGE